jgi:hypothetical protein
VQIVAKHIFHRLETLSPALIIIPVHQYRALSCKTSRKIGTLAKEALAIVLFPPAQKALKAAHQVTNYGYRQ